MAFNNRKKDVLKARKTQKRAAKKKVGAAVKHKQQLSLTGGKRTGAQPLEPDKGVAGHWPRLVGPRLPDRARTAACRQDEEENGSASGQAHARGGCRWGDSRRRYAARFLTTTMRPPRLLGTAGWQTCSVYQPLCWNSYHPVASLPTGGLPMSH